MAIGVKYRSTNDRKAGRAARFGRYVERGLFAADPEAMDELGFYELARNWALGWALDRRFLLVNLGPDTLAKDMKLLRRQLSEGANRRAAFLSWPTGPS